MIKNISNLGDAALYCDFGSDVNKEINSKVIKYFKNIKKKEIEGIINLTPSYNKLIISFDLKITNYNSLKKIIEKLELNKTEKLEQSRGKNASLRNATIFFFITGIILTLLFRFL